MAFAVAVLWRVKPGMEKRCEDLLRELQEKTRREPGCVHYYVHRTENPAQFFLYEQYVDSAASAAHHQTEHWRRLVRDEAAGLLEGRDATRYTTI
jgi:autoinducer 2-degrading protein